MNDELKTNRPKLRRRDIIAVLPARIPDSSFIVPTSSFRKGLLHGLVQLLLGGLLEPCLDQLAVAAEDEGDRDAAVVLHRREEVLVHGGGDGVPVVLAEIQGD